MGWTHERRGKTAQSTQKGESCFAVAKKKVLAFHDWQSFLGDGNWEMRDGGVLNWEFVEVCSKRRSARKRRKIPSSLSQSKFLSCLWLIANPLVSFRLLTSQKSAENFALSVPHHRPEIKEKCQNASPQVDIFVKKERINPALPCGCFAGERKKGLAVGEWFGKFPLWEF